MDVTKELRKEILRQNKNISAFARKIGVPQPSVNNILMRGVTNSTVSILYKIVEGLSIDFYALMNGEIKPYAPSYNITINEIDLINKYRQLSDTEKEDIRDLIELKYNKLLNKSKLEQLR